MGIRFTAARLFCETLPLLGDVSSKTLLTLGVQIVTSTTRISALSFIDTKFITSLWRQKPSNCTSGFKWVYLRGGLEIPQLHPSADVLRYSRLPIGQVHGALDVSDYEGAEIVHNLQHPRSGCAAARATT